MNEYLEWFHNLSTDGMRHEWQLKAPNGPVKARVVGDFHEDGTPCFLAYGNGHGGIRFASLQEAKHEAMVRAGYTLRIC